MQGLREESKVQWREKSPLSLSDGSLHGRGWILLESRAKGETDMTETEKMLRREIIRLETENKSLKQRLQIAEKLNWKSFRENEAMSLYVQALERLRHECPDRL